MQKHTPGPWIVNEADNGGEVANIFSDNPEHDGAYVCAVWSDESATGNDGADEETPQYVTDAEANANAALIAAAPDMLEALRDMLAEVAPDDGVRAMPSHSTIAAARFALAKAEGR